MTIINNNEKISEELFNATIDTEEEYNEWLASEAEYLDFGDDEDDWGDDDDW